MPLHNLSKIGFFPMYLLWSNLNKNFDFQKLRGLVMPLKVYYIDDEKGLCENFEDLFSVSDLILIKTFMDPEVAKIAIEADPPDILFLDYRLPNITGDQLAQSLDPAIPKYLVSGDIELKLKYKFLKIFPKPYSIDEVEALLSVYSSQKKGNV